MHKILLVENDPNYREVLATALELQGYCVWQAPGGQKAVEIIRHEPPDLIISDLEMNGLDGRALCKHIRGDADLHDIPFIILSAFVDPAGNGTLPDLPADRFVSKQLSHAQLMQMIRELLSEPGERQH